MLYVSISVVLIYGKIIYFKFGDEEELDDVLKYLELEQHFSTNPVKSM
jgi:hypothetical protein